MHFCRCLVSFLLLFSHLRAEEPGWVDLLADDSLELWQGNPDPNTGKPRTIGERWSLKDGVLHLDRSDRADGSNPRGGFITTKKKYFNFELSFEFLIAHDANSGIKYRTDDTGLGLEYQIIDDVHYRDNKNPTHRTASLYDLVAPDESKKNMPPAGEGWNTGRIIASGSSLEHWINGEQVLTIEFGSDDWNQRFTKSKFREHEGFAASAGSILLQDHQDTVSFRKLMIRELPEPEPERTAVAPAKSATTIDPQLAGLLPDGAPPAYVNCVACHLLDEVQVGPALVELAQIYPEESRDYFVEWCVNPGKKRPEMPQMPSMAHIPKDQLEEIHEYVLKATKGMKPKKNYARSDLFADVKRPRIVRTFVPESGPASIVVCLDTPGKHNLVWDTTPCRLRYVSKGEVDNWPYLRSNGNALADVGEIVHRESVHGGQTDRDFLGYQLTPSGLPAFRYSSEGKVVTESFSVSDQTLTISTAISGGRIQTRTLSLP